MHNHVHFDVYQAMWTVAIVGVGFHFLRFLGAFLVGKNVAVGRYIGTFATFNGGNG